MGELNRGGNNNDKNSSSSNNSNSDINKVSEKNKNKSNDDNSKKSQFSCIISAFHRLSIGILSLIIYFIISSKANISQQHNENWQKSHSFWYRFAFLSVSFLGERFKFYFAWKVSEGACIMGGFGYKNNDENIENINEKEKSVDTGKIKIESNGKINLEVNGKNGINGHKNGSNIGYNNGSNIEKIELNGINHEINSNNHAHISETNLNGTTDQNKNGKVSENENKISKQEISEAKNSWENLMKNFIYSDNWRGVENIDIFGFETGNNIQSLSRSWNKRTQEWLEKYVYQRTNRSLLCTYAVSALWHGLYPGFFLFFFAAALMSSVERLVRTKINPYILGNPCSPFSKSIYGKIISVIYNIICWFFTSITLTYHAQTFYMKTFEKSYKAFRSFYFIPNIVFIIFYFILLLLPTPPKIVTTKIEKKNN